MKPENLETMNQFMAALGNFDMSELEKCFHPEFVVRQANGHPYTGTYHGPRGFTDMLKIMISHYKFDAVEKAYTFVGEDPDHVAFQFNARGKTASGVPFNTTVMEHWIFRDGKVLELMPHWFEIPRWS